MNKQELIVKMAEKSGLSLKDSEKSLKAFNEVVAEALKNDDKVQLIGFGTYEPVHRKARTGRNPQNGEAIDIPQKTACKFVTGKKLSDYLNTSI